MPVRMVPDEQYEIVEIQFFILRGKYFTAERHNEIRKVFELLSMESKFKIRTFLTTHYVAQNMPRIKNPSGFGDFYIVWHYVFKNPNWDRFIIPDYYAVGGAFVTDYGKNPFFLKNNLADLALKAPSEKIKKAGFFKSQRQFMLWFNASMVLFP